MGVCNHKQFSCCSFYIPNPIYFLSCAINQLAFPHAPFKTQLCLQNDVPLIKVFEYFINGKEMKNDAKLVKSLMPVGVYRLFLFYVFIFHICIFTSPPHPWTIHFSTFQNCYLHFNFENDCIKSMCVRKLRKIMLSLHIIQKSTAFVNMYE